MPREAKVGGGVWHEYILLLKKKQAALADAFPRFHNPGPRNARACLCITSICVHVILEITNFPGRRRLPATSPSLKGEKPFTLCVCILNEE